MEANLRRRGVIKRDQVRVDGEDARSGAPASASAPPAAPVPRARLVRVDEHTQAIEFTCPCGEVSLIEIESEKKP
jgi:hypothetical protein